MLTFIAILIVTPSILVQGIFAIDGTPSLSTSSGRLQGKTVTTGHGLVKQYLSVPYAEKPIRFQLPKPLSTPELQRDSTRQGPACMQPTHLKETISPLLNTNDSMTSEDCLNLNIYVPEVYNKKPLPIVIWFPGEGFDFAIAQQFDGSYLAAIGKVIVVTINYRVSVFGFLSTGTKEAPGNLGFWDQRMAMQWVKQNADVLGGDSQKITLAGRFTGSMSITAQMTSPLNRDSRLFSRAILQSGVATGNWVFETEPAPNAFKMAESLGCNAGQSSEEVLRCLGEVSAEALVSKALTLPWRPVLDGQFLIEDPMESFQGGRVVDADVIFGINSNEGSLCLLSLYYTNSTYYEKVVEDKLTKEDLGNLLKDAVKDFTKKNPSHNLQVQTLALHEYGGHSDKERPRDNYIRFCGAMYITTQMDQAALFLSRDPTRKVYMYEFDHRPSFSIHPEFIKAAHGDDMLFSLGLVHQKPQLPKSELDLSKNIIESLSNFANSGTPSFSVSPNTQPMIWPRYTESNHQLVHFSALDNSIKSSSHDREVSFWHTVVPSVSGVLWVNKATSQIMSDRVLREKDMEIQAITNRTSTFIVGTLLNVQNTEYVLLTLVCLTLFLVVATALLPYCLIHRRIRKDNVLMEY